MKKSILIIDDDPDFAELMERLIGKDAVDVHVADNGEEGVERALQLKPDLVVMDVMMPGIHGLHAVERLRSDPVTALIPVLLVSTMPRGEIAGVEQSGAEFVDKGSLQGVAARIRQRLGLPE